MPAPVYSLRIFAHANLASGAGLVGPLVPAGLVYVLRDVDVVELSGTSGVVMGVYNQVAGFLWNSQRPSGVSSWRDSWRGRQVYGPGEQVGFQAFSGSWAIAASGYQLTLP